MAEIKVKAEHKKTVVGFNNSAKPLGERNDLHVLLNDVIGKGDHIKDNHIAGMFESLPTRAELDKILADKSAQKAQAVKGA